MQDVVLFKSGYETHVRQQDRSVPPVPSWLETWEPMQDCKVKQVSCDCLCFTLLPLAFHFAVELAACNATILAPYRIAHKCHYYVPLLPS